MAASQLRRPHNNIPDDIIVGAILPRLPVKTLLRFKCVCKLWHSVISHPNFKLATQDQSLVMVVLEWEIGIPGTAMAYQPITDEECAEKLYPDLTTCDHTIIQDKSVSPRFISNFHRITRLLGSCNGLVLISLDEHIFLVNPSIRCCRKVLELQALDHGKNIVAASGLIYDSSIDDYKAIVFFGNQMLVRFASLKTKKWRDVKMPYTYAFSGNYVGLHHAGPVVNERLHWLFRQNSDVSAEIKIFSFGSLSNKIEMLPVPEIGQEIGTGCALGVLDECLCLIIRQNKRTLTWNFDVWVMNQYGEKESWNRMFNLTNIEFWFWGPLFFTRGCEDLLFQTRDGIVAYDVEKQRCRELHEKKIGSDILIARTHMESLVSPDSYEWNDKKNCKEHEG